MFDLGQDEQFENDEKDFEESTGEDMYLTFEVNGEDYGISVMEIRDIIPIYDITVVPHTPDYLKGIINLRGDIIPVIDVRMRFRMPEKEYDDLTCVVVLEKEDYTIGLIVDRVQGAPKIPNSMVKPLPSAKLNYVNQYIKNIANTEDGVILFLDTDKLLFEQEEQGTFA